MRERDGSIANEVTERICIGLNEGVREWGECDVCIVETEEIRGEERCSVMDEGMGGRRSYASNDKRDGRGREIEERVVLIVCIR